MEYNFINMTPASLMITLAIITGQLIKIPVGSGGGTTLLDVVVIALSLFGLFQIKLRLIKPPTFIIASLSFILVALLSLMLTPLSLTTEEYLSSFLYIIRFSVYILLGWLLLSKALPSLKQNINQILLLSGGGLAVLGLFQFIFLPDLKFLSIFGWDPHYFRTASTFLDPNFLGGFMVLTLLIAFSSKKYFWSVVVYLVLMTTFSRSGYGMFLISFLTLAFWKRSAKLALWTIILFVILLFSFQIYIRAVNKVTPLDRSQTASLRLTTWQQGLQIFQKSPLLGIGFNAYKFALRQYNLGDEQFLQGKGATSNDSSLLHILATTGILGILTYFYFIQSLIKTAKPKNPILIAAIIGLLGHSFFVNSLFYPFVLIWIVLIAVDLYGKSTN